MLKILFAGFLLTISSMALASDRVLVAEGTQCPQMYLPVCGTKDGKRMTYSNKCFAGVAQATDIVDGKCEDTK